MSNKGQIIDFEIKYNHSNLVTLQTKYTIMAAKPYQIQIERFLKHFTHRNNRRIKTGYDAQNVLEWSLKDYRSDIYQKALPSYGIIIGLVFLPFINLDSIPYLLISVGIIFLTMAVLIRWGYKWVPRIDYYPQIKRRIDNLSKSIDSNCILDEKLMRNVLMLDENLRNINLLEIYYNRLGLSDSNKKEEKINNLSKLLSLYYLTRIKLSNKKSDEEKILLASCLLDIGKGGLSKRFKTQLNKLINLDIDKAKKDDFNVLRDSLNTSKHSIEDVLIEIKKAIAKIDNLPN